MLFPHLATIFREDQKAFNTGLFILVVRSCEMGLLVGWAGLPQSPSQPSPTLGPTDPGGPAVRVTLQSFPRQNTCWLWVSLSLRVSPGVLVQD